MPLMQYPDDLQRKLSDAKRDFESTQQRVRTATDLLLKGEEPAEDVASLLADASRAFHAYLSEIAARAKWLHEFDMISLLSWIDRSPDRPDKVELLRTILWDELYTVVGSISESLRATASFPMALQILERCHTSYLQRTRQMRADSS